MNIVFHRNVEKVEGQTVSECTKCCLQRHYWILGTCKKLCYEQYVSWDQKYLI